MEISDASSFVHFRTNSFPIASPSHSKHLVVSATIDSTLIAAWPLEVKEGTPTYGVYFHLEYTGVLTQSSKYVFFRRLALWLLLLRSGTHPCVK